MYDEYVLWSEGTGHIGGTFWQQPIWQAKPHTSHTTPWRVRPTISDVQWLHFVGEENVLTRNWWDLGLGGEMRGHMRGLITQVKFMWSSWILWNNNHIQINIKMKNNILSEQLISEEYIGRVAHWNTQNSILHESILYQKL